MMHHRKNKNIVYLFSLFSLPEQEKNYCIVDFYVVIQRSIWKVTGSPEMFMRFLVPTDNRVEPVVVGPLQIER